MLTGLTDIFVTAKMDTVESTVKLVKYSLYKLMHMYTQRGIDIIHKWLPI